MNVWVSVRTDDWMDNWMHDWENVGVGCLLVVAWAYRRILHTRGPLPICLRALRHIARGPAGLLVTGQNGSGQNGTDKMVWTKWYTDKMALDKMVWTKWYGQNGTNLYFVSI